MVDLDFKICHGEGPAPKYSYYHIWKAYNVINDYGPIGRKKLSTHLRLGEGSTRTILCKMIQEGTVEITKTGAILTERGLKLLRNSTIDVRPVDLRAITIAKINCAIRVPGHAHLVKSGCEQRDQAVKAGAFGATTLLVKNGAIILPEIDLNVSDDVDEALRNTFDLMEGDVIIIGSAMSYESAERGAVAAALNLMEKTAGTEEAVMSILESNSDLESLGIAIHELLGRLPLAIRSKNCGVLIEDGSVVERNFDGPILQEAFHKKVVVRRNSPQGTAFHGIPIVAVPITRGDDVVAVIGVVDITKGALFDLITRAQQI